MYIAALCFLYSSFRLGSLDYSWLL